MKFRTQILKHIQAQQVQYAPGTTIPTTTTYNANYNITAVPGFKTNLFRNRPDMIRYFNQLGNIINKYLTKLSNGKVSIVNTYLTPAMSSSEFSNDLKHFFDLAKWLYYVIVNAKTPAYTIQGFVQFANDLINLVRSRSFVDTNARDEVVVLAQNMLATLKA